MGNTPLMMILTGLGSFLFIIGAHCRPDGRFVVFDSHLRSFEQLGPAWKSSQGAFLALLMDAADTSSFICHFVLSSQAAILDSLAEEPTAKMIALQEEAARTLQMAAFERALPLTTS